ncbi:MAG: hypothetical protein LBG43_04560, partial [Treponema sp.]|nr:hypothetical protein [Treponema sp.]
MRFILQKEYDRQHQKSGGPDKLSIEGKLTATFKCRRECRAMESIGVDCQAGESAVCQSVQWAGGAPLKGGAFNPPGKKALAGTPREI